MKIVKGMVRMYKAYKFRIYPNEEKKYLFIKLLVVQDLSIIITLSDGETYENNKYILKYEKKLRDYKEG